MNNSDPAPDPNSRSGEPVAKGAGSADDLDGDSPRAMRPLVQPNLMQLAASGMELAIYTLTLGAAGYAVDHFRGHHLPWVGIAGALIGFVLGMYRLILLATRPS